MIINDTPSAILLRIILRHLYKFLSVTGLYTQDIVLILSLYVKMYPLWISQTTLRRFHVYLKEKGKVRIKAGSQGTQQ